MEQDWPDNVYQSIFDRISVMLEERRRRGDTRQTIRQSLEWKYIASEIDWVGKGEVWHVTQEATIAAYEAFLAAWDDQAEA